MPPPVAMTKQEPMITDGTTDENDYSVGVHYPNSTCSSTC